MQLALKNGINTHNIKQNNERTAIKIHKLLTSLPNISFPNRQLNPIKQKTVRLALNPKIDHPTE